MRAPLRVLGVDTSLRSTGYGVVERKADRLNAVCYGLIRNPPGRVHSECLHELYTGIARVIDSEHPDCVAVEGVFFCKNVRTAVILGQARGAVLAACAAVGLAVYEYAPRRVKQSVVGVGGAQKNQVGHMIKALLGLDVLPRDDEADALAVAVCHIHAASGPGKELVRI